MEEEKCPCCPNHCEKENLSCGRGKDYFEGNNAEPEEISEKVLRDLKKCGHFLHHNHGINKDNFFKNLSDEELKILHELLIKLNSNM